METRQSPRRSLKTCSITATISARTLESPVFCISTVTAIPRHCTKRGACPRVTNVRPFGLNSLLEQALLPLLELHRGFQRLSIAHHSHFHQVANLAAAQSVREVVEIVDGLVTELHQDISTSEP